MNKTEKHIKNDAEKAERKSEKIRRRKEMVDLRAQKAAARIRRHTPFQLVLTKIIIILAIICIMMSFGYFGWKKGSEVTVTKSYAMVKESLTFWQEFVTLKYRYSDIVSVKKENFFSTSYTLVKYTGIVRAGIADITDCEITVSADGSSLKILLPPAEILGNEIESQEVFDEKHSIFVPLTLDEIFTEIANSKDIALAEIEKQGILEEARSYAKKMLSQIFITAGFKTVQVEYK